MIQSERVKQTEQVLISAAEFAKMIGCSRSAFYKRCVKGIIGPKQIALGQFPMFRRSEVLDWIAAGCPKRSEWEAVGLAKSLIKTGVFQQCTAM